MSNKSAVSGNLGTIIFREHATAPLGKRLLSLFPGLGYAAGYKVSQRIYKFGGQPMFNDLIVSKYKTNFTNTFGERKGKMMMQATAGSLTGIGEVVRFLLLLLSMLSETRCIASASSRRPQDQEAGKPRGVPWAWGTSDIHGGGHDSLPWLGLDNGAERSRFLRSKQICLSFPHSSDPTLHSSSVLQQQRRISSALSTTTRPPGRRTSLPPFQAPWPPLRSPHL